MDNDVAQYLTKDCNFLLYGRCMTAACLSRDANGRWQQPPLCTPLKIYRLLAQAATVTPVAEVAWPNAYTVSAWFAQAATVTPVAEACDSMAVGMNGDAPVVDMSWMVLWWWRALELARTPEGAHQWLERRMYAVALMEHLRDLAAD